MWLLAPLAAGATISASPTATSSGNYTVSWTDASGGLTRAYLATSVNSGAWSKITVTGTYSKAYTARPAGTYRHKIQIYVYDGELRQEIFEYETNVVEVFVGASPGVPGAIAGPSTSSTGSYALTWGAATGSPTRYELLENGALAYSGPALSADLSGRPDGTHVYAVRACNPIGCGPTTATHQVAVARSLSASVPETGQPIRPVVVPAQGPAGTLPGQPSADGGAAGYRIPIEVPPGRAGMEPELALAYGSRSGNGIAGVGWGLSGSSAIHRCPRTVAHEGASAPVSLGQGDRLCLDGARLVAVAGETGEYASEYRTEIDPFDRITLRGGTMQQWTSWFEVEHKSGRISHYLPLRKNVGLAPDTWVLARAFDRAGDCVAYEYARFGSARAPASEEEWVLSSVKYTGWSPNRETCDAGGDGRRVTFTYAPRPDARRTYQAGAPTIASARLQAIVTHVGATPVRRYELSHRSSAATGRSLLTGVTVCPALGLDGSQPCGADKLQATVFGYQEGPPEGGPGSFAVERFTHPKDGTTLRADWRVETAADYDGDGTRDTLYTQVTSQGPVRKIALSGCPAGAVELVGAPVLGDVGELNWLADFLEPVLRQWLPVDPLRFTSDVDDDGRADLIAAVGGKMVVVSLGCEDGEVVYQWEYATDAAENRLPIVATAASAGDVDGDGLVDVVYFEGASSRRWFRRLPTNPPSQLKFEGPLDFPVLSLGAGEKLGLSADFDGDGRRDKFITNGNGAERIAFLKPNGTAALGYQSFDLPYLGANVAWTANTGWMDVNGDGLPDIYAFDAGGNFTIWLNRGGTPGPGMFRQVSAVGPAAPSQRLRKAVAMDFDSDGIDELMVPTTRAIAWCGGNPDAKLWNGDPYFWCGDEFDEPGADDSYDWSVFLWEAWEFRETTAGTFTAVRTPTTLQDARDEGHRGKAGLVRYARDVPDLRCPGEARRDHPARRRGRLERGGDPVPLRSRGCAHPHPLRLAQRCGLGEGPHRDRTRRDLRQPRPEDLGERPRPGALDVHMGRSRAPPDAEGRAQRGDRADLRRHRETARARIPEER